MADVAAVDAEKVKAAVAAALECTRCDCRGVNRTNNLCESWNSGFASLVTSSSVVVDAY